MLSTNVQAASQTNQVTPTENQYLELRGTTITETKDQGKQLIMELWAHELDFARFYS